MITMSALRLRQLMQLDDVSRVQHVRAPNHRMFSCRRLLTVPAASPENNSSLAEAVSGL
jgi:hypothetical protein